MKNIAILIVLSLLAYLSTGLYFVRPDEEVVYELVLVSNQPQTFPLNIEIVSRNHPDPIMDRDPETVTVIP